MQKEVIILPNKKDLSIYEKYNLNTFLLPLSNYSIGFNCYFNVEEIMNAITQNQDSKDYKKLEKIDVKKYREPDEVVKKKEIIKLKTEVPKIAYNIKLPLTNLSLSKKKYNLYLFILFSCLFDDTSYFDEQAKNENLITNSLYINLLNCDSHLLISLINETPNYEKL